MKEFNFDQVDRSKPWALFFDIDGTLVEFADTPDAVVMPDEVTTVLQRLSAEANGSLAIITGRPIPSADRLFQPIEFPMAGLHGGEFRIEGRHETIPVPTIPDHWRHRAKGLAKTCPGVSFEEKRQGFALHFREAPHHAPTVNDTLSELVGEPINPGYHLLQASGATEIRPDGIDKGSAIEKFMETAAFAGRHPIFFGDDTTDDDGFRALKKRGGTTVLVGRRSPAEAEYFVSDPQAMRGLLAGLKLPN
jgi:trehalose 6-phosphate phosphatase